MRCFKHSGCKNYEPHDPRLVSRVWPGNCAADSRIDDEAHKNKEGEDNRAPVPIPNVVGAIDRGAALRRDKMDSDHNEGKNDRYYDA
jgi:hypothetical protein